MKIKFKKVIIVSMFIVLSTVLAMISISNITKRETASLLQKENNYFYRVACRYGSDNYPDFSELFNSADSLQRLKQMNSELKKRFDYVELNFQPLYSIGYYDKPLEFVDSYDDTLQTAETVNQIIGLENSQPIYVTDLKTIQMPQKFIFLYNDLIDSGRNFTDADFFIRNSNDSVNIILGNEYSKYYKIGDLLHLTLHQKEITFKVIGFYKKGTLINLNNTIINFDHCIIMPFYDVEYSPQDEKEYTYQTIYYSQKNEGYINSKDMTFSQIDAYLNEIASRTNLAYSLVTNTISISLQK